MLSSPITQRILVALLLLAGCSSVSERLKSGKYRERREAVLTLAARLQEAEDGEFTPEEREEILRPLRAALGDSSPMVRSAAISSLGSVKDHQSIPRIAPFLQDRSWDVRLSTTQALRVLGAKEHLPAIGEILRNDSKAHCRREAARALGEFGLVEGVDACLDGISEREPDQNVRYAAWMALQSISGKKLPFRSSEWEAWRDEQRVVNEPPSEEETPPK
ncbi:MAG: HEAT repeat domain-containing protein [Planctomycetota bacterium]|nr:HEAT repeat domain-containing protein [Planctomycetota bacterium]